MGHRDHDCSAFVLDMHCQAVGLVAAVNIPRLEYSSVGPSSVNLIFNKDAYDANYSTMAKFQ